MAIPELVRRRCERELTKLYDARVPVVVRHKIELEYSFRGNDVVLFERRPPWRGEGEWSKSKVARFKYEPESKTWSLYCVDRNGRWHLYEGFEQVKVFEELVSEVDSDPTAIFWG